MAGSLTQPDISRDDGLKYLFFEMVPYFLGHLMGEVVADVEHGEKNPFDLQSRIERLFDQTDRLEQLSQAFQGGVFALEGNEDGMGCCQRVDGQKPEGGGAIDEDVVII